MKVKRLLGLGIGVVCAGGAFILAQSMFNQPPERVVETVVQKEEIQTTEVLVAAVDISLGNSLNSEMVKWQKWPKEGIAPGYITRDESPEGLSDIDKAIARAAFFNGEPIRESKLVRSDRGYMSAILPAGQRAIATNISVATSAGGFILPNDRVDVIMTRRNPNEGADGFITENVLENVRVLAIDQTVEEKDGESVVVGQTATLQLSPEQARILTVAQQMSDRLTLALRSLADATDTETRAARHLLSGERGSGRVRVIRYGRQKEILTGSGEANAEAEAGGTGGGNDN